MIYLYHDFDLFLLISLLCSLGKLIYFMINLWLRNEFKNIYLKNLALRVKTTHLLWEKTIL